MLQLQHRINDLKAAHNPLPTSYCLRFPQLFNVEPLPSIHVTFFFPPEYLCCFMLPCTSLNYCLTCDALFHLGTILMCFLAIFPHFFTSLLLSYSIYAYLALAYGLSPYIVFHYLSVCLSPHFHFFALVSALWLQGELCGLNHLWVQKQEVPGD